MLLKILTFQTVVLRRSECEELQNYSPKRQFCITTIFSLPVYKLKIYKTVSIETPTQHSIYETFK